VKPEAAALMKSGLLGANVREVHQSNAGGVTYEVAPQQRGTEGERRGAGRCGACGERVEDSNDCRSRQRSAGPLTPLAGKAEGAVTTSQAIAGRMRIRMCFGGQA